MQRKIFPTKKHFSNYLKDHNNDTFFISPTAQEVYKSIKEHSLINLQVPITYQQKFLQLLKNFIGTIAWTNQ